jgi:hypothetical protein
VGTSTGGILALGLTVPDAGRPKHTAEQLLGLYVSEAGVIFPGGGPQTLTRRVSGTRDPGAWFRDPVELLVRRSSEREETGGARYPLAGLEDVLARYLGDGPLADAVADVVVTSYDIAFHEPVLFSSRDRPGFVTDASMRVAARATSAGPTYFEPQELTSGDRRRVLVDGGVYVNNPSILGYLLGGRAATSAATGLLLVSLGTGTRPPRTPSTPEELRMGDALLRGLADGDQFHYWRIQTDVGACSFAMDDSSPENVACLSACARELALDRRDDLDAIAAAVAR